MENDKPKEASLCARQIISQKGNLEAYHVYAAKGLLKEGNLPEAKKVLEEGINAFPNSSELALQNGVVSQGLGDIAAAEASY